MKNKGRFHVKRRVVNASRACLDFFEDQVLRLLWVRPCNASEKGRQRSYWVGLSCLLIWLLPWAYLYWAMEEATVWDYLVYGLLGVSSFCGDYLFVNTKVYPVISRHVAFFDNWVAIIAVIFNIDKLIRYGQFLDIRTALCFSLVFLALPLLYLSRHITSQKRWIFVHTLWHFLAVGIIFAVLEVQRVG